MATTCGPEWDARNFAQTCAALRGELLPEVTFGPDAGQIRSGRAEGRLVGGNLALLQCLAGTPCDIDTAGRILFIEDVDEYLYQVDRMLAHLALAGKLRDLAGLVAGDFTNLRDNEDAPFGEDLREIIARHTAPYKYPVAYGFPAGHGRVNLPLVMGGACELEVERGRARLRPLPG